jgi:uncharacterized protein (TIGR03437 family)
MGLRTIIRNIALGASITAGAASAQSTTPVIAGVVNAASYAPGVSEGGLATIAGNNLSDKNSLGDVDCAITSPFPTSVCGVAVLVDGTPAPLLYIGPSQINFQVPYGVGQHELTVRNNGRLSKTVPLAVLDRSPGIFAYNAGSFPNLAAAQLADYTVHAPANPVVLATTPTLHSYLSLYLTGLGIPTNHPAPPLGIPAPIPQSVDDLLLARDVSVIINGKPLPRENILYTGYGPGLIIQQINILPPTDTPSGANNITVCAADACSNSVTVFMTNTNDYIAGSLTNPGIMSDAKTRTLSTITGTATSDLGTDTIAVNKDGNYLARAKGKTTLGLPATTAWESYQDTVTANGATIIPTIPAFPHIVYDDVKGDYDPTTYFGTWNNTSYYDPLWNEWRGTPGGGPVTLFNMVRSLSTDHGNSPACPDVTMMWAREDEPIKIYLDTSGQPYYDPNPSITGAHALIQNGTIPANAIAGTDVLWQELQASPGRGGPSFRRVSQPLAPQEHGATFKFATLTWGTGLTGLYSSSGPNPQCEPIARATTVILPTMGTTDGVAAAGRHELLSRVTGYGSNGNFSPFMTDNIGTGAHVTDSARDLDGRKMAEFLGFGINLSKYAK